MTFSATYLQCYNLGVRSQEKELEGVRSQEKELEGVRSQEKELEGVRSQEKELEGDKNSPNYPKFIHIDLRLSAVKNS
jgi:hypothetical protein